MEVATYREQVFHQRLLEYYEMNAEKQCLKFIKDNKILLDEPLTKKDYKVLAINFETKKDCNKADNTIWKEVIRKYLKRYL